MIEKLLFLLCFFDISARAFTERAGSAVFVSSREFLPEQVCLTSTVRANNFLLMDIPFARCDGILNLDAALLVVAVVVTVVSNYTTLLSPSSDHPLPF